MVELNLPTPYYKTDTGRLLAREDYIEKILTSEGYDIADEDNCIDSTLVHDYVEDLGFTNLGYFNDGYIFVNDTSEVINGRILDKYFSK